MSDENKQEKRDIIFIMNTLSPIHMITVSNKRYVFEYDTPVEVDYTDNPELVRRLLNAPELRVATSKDVELAKARKLKLESERKKRAESNEKASKDALKAEKDQREQARKETLEASQKKEEKEQEDFEDAPEELPQTNVRKDNRNARK